MVSPELPHPHSHMTPRQAAGVWFVKEVRIQPEFIRQVIASGTFTCDLSSPGAARHKYVSPPAPLRRLTASIPVISAGAAMREEKVSISFPPPLKWKVRF